MGGPRRTTHGCYPGLRRGERVCRPTLEFSPDGCRCTGVGQNAKDYYIKICDVGQVCPGTGEFIYVSIRANTGPEPKEKFFH